MGRTASYVQGRAEIVLPLREGEAPPAPPLPPSAHSLPSAETQARQETGISVTSLLSPENTVIMAALSGFLSPGRAGPKKGRAKAPAGRKGISRPRQALSHPGLAPTPSKPLHLL